MSFDTDETSPSRSRPINLYTITTPTTTYRVTSNIVNVVYGGNTFTALTMGGDNETLNQDPTSSELIVHLPISHPLVQRYAAFGVPEQTVIVTTQRLQSVSGVAVQAWTGFGQSISIDGHVAKLRVPAVTADALKLQLPVISSQPLCNHVLFDSRCSRIPGTDGPDPALFQFTTTIAAVSADGLTVTIADTGGNPSGWAQFGRIITSDATQSRLILSQRDTTLTINAPLIAPSSTVTIQVGCDHRVQTCRDKFANVVNFGGAPNLNPVSNLWAPSGLGIQAQA